MAERAEHPLFQVQSQLAYELRDYYDALIRRLNRTPWLSGDKCVRVKDVAVPVRVWRRTSGGNGTVAGDAEPGRYESKPGSEGRASGACQGAVSWERESRSVRRGVILGLPGSGKSFLARVMVIREAEDSLARLSARSTPIESVGLPVHVRLVDLAKDGLPVNTQEALARLALGAAEPGRVLWNLTRRMLCSPESLLVLDSLDEVHGEDAVSRLGARLKDLENPEKWRGRIVITSRTSSYAREKIGWEDLTEFDLAPFDDGEIGQLIRQWYGSGPRGPELLSRIERNPALQSACRSPLVTAMVCYQNDRGMVGPGTRRVDLYANVLRGMMERVWRSQPAGNLRSQREYQLSRTAQMAWRLFSAHPGSNQFRCAEVLGEASEKMDGSDKDGLELVAGLEECGILAEAGRTRGGEPEYSFPHKTFLDFFCAKHLASVVDQPGAGWERARVWHPEVGGTVPVARLIDRKSWLGEYAELVAMLAGLLADPGPMPRLLSDRQSDDMYRHRLALSLAAMAECQRRDPALLDGLTGELLGLWEKHGKQSAGAEHLRRALPLCLSMAGRFEGKRLTDWLMSTSSEADFDRMVRTLGAGAFTPAVKDRLMKRASDWRGTQPADAIFVLGSLAGESGGAAALGGLLKLTRDREDSVRKTAAEVLGWLDERGVTTGPWQRGCWR